MSARNIGIVYRKELTEALRDRRTLITMFVLPLIIFPLLSVGFGAMIAVLIGKAKEESPKVMIIGGEDSPNVLAGLKKVPKIQVVPLEANWKDAVVNKQVPVVVEIPEGFERNLANQKEQTVLIHDYEGDLKSEIAKNKIEKYFNDYRDSVVKDRLAAFPSASSSRSRSSRTMLPRLRSPAVRSSLAASSPTSSYFCA